MSLSLSCSLSSLFSLLFSSLLNVVHKKREKEEKKSRHTQTRATNSLRFYLAHIYIHIHRNTAPFNVKSFLYKYTNGQYKRRVLQRQFVLSLFKLSEKFVFDLVNRFRLFASLLILFLIMYLFSIRILLVHLHERQRERETERKLKSIKF